MDIDIDSGTPLIDKFVEMGIVLPPPDALNDNQLAAKLWEVIEALTFLGAYLEHTDHLSDRELYRLLLDEELREAALFAPDDPNSAWHIDLVGSGSEEDVALFLTYYADEEERQLWAKDGWDAPLPDPKPRPHDRDRHLPKPHRGDPSPVQ